MADLVITNGIVVDGTSTPPRPADVAVTGEYITAVADPGTLQAADAVVLDAAGALVLPGFVALSPTPRTALAADPTLASACLHGVTTLVATDPTGPLRPPPGAWAADLLCFTTLADLAAMVGLDPADGRTSRAQRRALARAVRRALAAGSPGVALDAHGDLRHGHDAQLHATVARAMRRARTGRWHLTTPTRAAGTGLPARDLAATLAAASRRPVTVSGGTACPDRTDWQARLGDLDALAARGLDVTLEVATRPRGPLTGLWSPRHPFAHCPAVAELDHLPLPQRVAALTNPQRRLTALAQYRDGADPGDVPPSRIGDLVELADPACYDPDPARTVGAQALHLGVEPAALAYDLLARGDGSTVFLLPWCDPGPDDRSLLRPVLVHERTVLGHTGSRDPVTGCDTSMPTTTLAAWHRDADPQGRIPLEDLVHRLTARNAVLAGLADRGTVAAGRLADLLVVDLEALACHRPRTSPVTGLLTQGAAGYRAVVKSGEVTFTHGIHTGALPGRTLASPPAP